MILPAQDIVERLRERAKRMNGALVGASDGGTYALGYYDQFAAADDKEAADTVSRLTADNEALRKERDAARAAHHKTSHKAVKRLRALWREKQAAETCVTSLEAEVRRLRTSLRDQFCPRPCNWRPSEFDVGDCVDAGECGCSSRSALANEEAGR